MIGKTSLIWLGLASLSGAVAFHTSYRAQKLSEELAGLNRAISAEDDTIRVLKAEWSYLDEPDRIEPLARRYLPDLRPTTPDQIATSLAAIPAKPGLESQVATVGVPPPQHKPKLPRAGGVRLAAYGDAP
jgi:hypothetical protein